MAIQLRRGDYEDFDKTKMQGGELAVVTSNDPNTESGCATYVSYASGDENKVKRLLQEGELEEALEVIEQYVDANNENKPKIFTLEGSNVPVSQLGDYPGAKLGDFCINKSCKVWICVYAEAGGITWSEIPNSIGSYLWDTFYSKVQIDNKLNTKADKTYVDSAIGAVSQFKVSIVNELPTENIDTHTVYFVPKEDTDINDSYDEWMYLNENWEHIGNTVIDLRGYVPVNRTIAGLSLDNNISADDLGKKILASNIDYEFYSKVYDTFPTLKNTELFKSAVNNICKSKATVFCLDGNNEPTTNASEYPNVKLGDICVNESYRAWICQYLYEGSNTVVWSEILTPTSSYLTGNYYTKSLIDNMLKEKENKSDWQLIRKIEITEELGAVEITKDKEENTFKYDDIMVIGNNVKGSNSGNWWVSFKTTANPTNSGIIQIGNANPLSSTTAKLIHTKIKRMFGLDRYEYESYYRNTGAYVSTINKGTYSVPFELSEETKINYVRIHFSTNNTINAGTILVYGIKRR